MKLCLACRKPFESRDWVCPRCGHRPLEQNNRLFFAPDSSESNSGFDIALFSSLAAIEEKNFWYRTRNRLLVWSLKKYFPDARTFFEVGCGTGFVLKGFSESFDRLGLSGCELYSRALDFASQRAPRAQLFQMDARQLPFEGEFEVAGAFDVLEHVEEDTKVLAQMHQALKPGGGILLTVPQHPFLWSAYDEQDHHVRRYRSSELKKKVENAGFDVIRTTSFVCALLPAMALSRLAVRKKDPDFNVMTDFITESPMNTAFKKILDVERALIRLGVSLPFGGSLLLVGRKRAGL